MTTPEKDVNKLRKQGNGGVRKALLFGSAIFRAIKERYSASKSYKEKQLISKLIATRIRKYRMTGGAQAILGIPRYAIKLINHDDTGKVTVSSRRTVVVQPGCTSSVEGVLLGFWFPRDCIRTRVPLSWINWCSELVHDSLSPRRQRGHREI